MEDVGLLYSHYVYFMTIWYILWPFGTLYGHLVYFPQKNLETLVGSIFLNKKSCSLDHIFTFIWAEYPWPFSE
jgi:hypothetical protein